MDACIPAKPVSVQAGLSLAVSLWTLHHCALHYTHSALCFWWSRSAQLASGFDCRRDGRLLPRTAPGRWILFAAPTPAVPSLAGVPSACSVPRGCLRVALPFPRVHGVQRKGERVVRRERRAVCGFAQGVFRSDAERGARCTSPLPTYCCVFELDLNAVPMRCVAERRQ